MAGFKALSGTKTVNGIDYNFIAERYDGYGIHVLLCLDDQGCPNIISWQDYCNQINPTLHFDLTPTLVVSDDQ